jgi:cell division protein ZapA
METTTVISVQLAGRSYQLKCPVSEGERLKSASEYINAKVKALNQNGNVGFEKTATLVALDICCELFRLRDEISSQEQQLVAKLNHLEQRIGDTIQNVSAVNQHYATKVVEGDQHQLDL